MKLYNFFNVIPPWLSIVGNSEFRQLTWGIVESEVDKMPSAEGPLSDKVNNILNFMKDVPYIDLRTQFVPDIVNYRDLLEGLKCDHGMHTPRCEATVKQAYSGEKININNQFDVINTYLTLQNLFSVVSLDASKIQGDSINYRYGYHNEQYVSTGLLKPLRNVPLLSDQKGPVACQSGQMYRAKIDDKTRRIITVMFGFVNQDIGCYINLKDQLPKNLIDYKNTYILVKNKMYYIRLNGKPHQINIKNINMLIKYIKEMPYSNKIYLNQDQAQAIIKPNELHYQTMTEFENKLNILIDYQKQYANANILDMKIISGYPSKYKLKPPSNPLEPQDSAPSL